MSASHHKLELPRTPALPLLQERRHHVVGLGTNVVDRVALVDRVAAADQKVLVEHGETHPGGAVCNNLAQAARLGARTAWVGFLGNDPEGRYLLREMAEVGIDAGHAKQWRRRRTPVSWIAVDREGERAAYMFPNVNRLFRPDHVDRYFAPAIRTAVHFHTEASQVPLAAVLRAIQVAREADVKVLFDLDVPPDYLIGTARLGTEDQLEQILSLCHVLKPTRKAAEALTRRRGMEEAALDLLKRGPELVAITSGAEGALLAVSGEMVKVPALPTEVRDTTGAGDAFMGGLSFALLTNQPLSRAGLIANACAARCVARVGARAQADYAELRELLATAPVY